MKYCHGTDSKRKNQFWVWCNRVLIGTFALFALVFVLAGCYFMAAGVPVWCSVFLWGFSVLLFFAVLHEIWMNSRYSADTEGITVSTFLKDRRVFWNEVQEIGIFPVFQGRRRLAYIIIFTSERYKLMDSPIPLERCWANNDEMLAIRCTDERCKEFAYFLHRDIPTAVYNNWTNKYEIKQADRTRKDAE